MGAANLGGGRRPGRKPQGKHRAVAAGIRVRQTARAVKRLRFHFTPLMAMLLRSINWAATTFNDLPVWKGECHVWTQRMRSPNFERWLYLRAHQVGLMGRDGRPMLAKYIRPGMRVMDIGSNLGLYSITMARLVGPTGHVTCFEPDPTLFAVFGRNCELNAVGNISAHNLALGSTRARLQFHKMIINSGDNHFGITEGSLFRRTVEAEVVALDEFIPDLAVDFIKIDVQGWELEVLRGMRAVLQANRAVRVYFEFSPQNYLRAGSSYAEVIAFLRGLGFRIIGPEDDTELSDAAIAALARSLPGKRYTNLIAAR
jgi:FkbM family methyltransferase